MSIGIPNLLYIFVVMNMWLMIVKKIKNLYIHIKAYFLKLIQLKYIWNIIQISPGCYQKSLAIIPSFGAVFLF